MEFYEGGLSAFIGSEMVKSDFYGLFGLDSYLNVSSCLKLKIAKSYVNVLKKPKDQIVFLLFLHNFDNQS